MKTRTPGDRDHTPRQLITDPIENRGTARPDVSGRDHARDTPRGDAAPPTSLTRPPRATSENPLPEGQRDPDNLDEDDEDTTIERDPP